MINMDQILQQAQQQPHAFDKADIVALLDLTRLEPNDTSEKLIQLAQQGVTSKETVAALCVYPQFIKPVKEALQGKPIHIATVANFPEGKQSIEDTCQQIAQAIAAGADEIDVVSPYHYYLENSGYHPFEFLEQCREICGETTLKVIIESGALKQPALIAKASQDAITAGADFLKTSTGKTSQGATLEAAAIMLSQIQQSSNDIGFKASGGIKTYHQACQYLTLAQTIMGPDWIHKNHFRFGASSLLKELCP